MTSGTTISNCRFCGQTHGVRCPSVKSIEYFEDGVTVKKVEFTTPSDYLAPLSPAPPANPWPYWQYSPPITTPMWTATSTANIATKPQ